MEKEEALDILMEISVSKSLRIVSYILKKSRKV